MRKFLGKNQDEVEWNEELVDKINKIKVLSVKKE